MIDLRDARTAPPPLLFTLTALVTLLCAGCGADDDLSPAPATDEHPQDQADLDPSRDGDAQRDSGEEAAPTTSPEDERCVPFAPSQAWPELDLAAYGPPPADVLICPDEDALEAVLAERVSVTRAQAPTPNEFEDPVPALTGQEIYDRSVASLGRVAWFVPMLMPQGTPPLSQAQIDALEGDRKLLAQHQTLWKARGGGPPRKLYSPVGGRRWQKLKPLLRRYKRKKEVLRALLLRGDMLYVEDMRAAADIYRFVGLVNLFGEDTIYLRRGDVIHELHRRDHWTYVHTDGPMKGARARLLLYDRVALDRAALGERVGWDLNRLRPRAALKSFKVTTYDAEVLRGTATTRGNKTLPGAAFYLPARGESDDDGDKVGDDEGRLTLALVIDAEARDATLAEINEDRAGASLKAGILQAGEKMVAEALRFDEPKTEEGQQDGMLRWRWLAAYRAGAHSYTFNGDRYTVFTRQGDPDVPQVCIDFVYDSIDRWSGNWWTPRGQGRHHTEGTINIADYTGRIGRRQVSQLTRMPKEHPDIFQAIDYPLEERIPYKDTEGFYGRLEALSETTLPGDIITIYGKKDDDRNHWHSFMVYDLDPMYHQPYLLIGNAGRARVQVWHDVMRTGPRRAITHRIQLREDWLEQRRPAEPSAD